MGIFSGRSSDRRMIYEKSRVSLISGRTMSRGFPLKLVGGRKMDGAFAESLIKRLPRTLMSPGVAGTIAISAGIAVGAGRVLSNYRSKLRQTQSTGIQKFVFGPGYPVWFKTKGMGHENLGASGDLTLSLNKMRHSSIF